MLSIGRLQRLSVLRGTLETLSSTSGYGAIHQAKPYQFKSSQALPYSGISNLAFLSYALLTITEDRGLSLKG